MPNSIYLLGDLHLSASQPWRLPTGDAFLEWFDNFEPEPNSVFIGMGDYTDDAVNPGEVVRQLERFIETAKKKFDKVYLLVGNHDLKLYKNKPQLAFSFVREKEGIVILEDPAEIVEIQGLKILSLPHYNYRSDVPPMVEYYENLPQEILDQEYDMVIGHFANTSAQLFAHMVDLTPIKTKLTCLGDIHTRVSKDYIGSVFACKITENETPRPRAVWKVYKDGEDVIKEEIPLPHFCNYQVVDYPNPLPEETSPVTVYTILGAENETIALNFYPNIFLRGVQLSRKKLDKKAATSSDDFEFSSPVEVFNDWLKEVKQPVSRPVAKLIRGLLKPTQSTKKASVD